MDSPMGWKHDLIASLDAANSSPLRKETVSQPTPSVTCTCHYSSFSIKVLTDYSGDEAVRPLNHTSSLCLGILLIVLECFGPPEDEKTKLFKQLPRRQS